MRVATRKRRCASWCAARDCRSCTFTTRKPATAADSSNPETHVDDPERFAELLHSLYERNHESLGARFQRSLSFQEGAFDRWERARRLSFGEGASIYNS